MIVISFLPLVLELFLVSAAFINLFLLGSFLKPPSKLFISILFYIGILFACASIIVGGISVVAMIVKVLFFVIAIAYSIRKPEAARWWLIFSIVISLLAQASVGNVLNKLSTLPFLMFACLWVITCTCVSSRELIILALALGAECAQALVLESRGLLLAVVMACGLLLCPLNLVRRAVVICAILLPIVYPLVLKLVLTELLSGSEFLSATSSNFERSAMASWCVDNFFSYPVIGPGSDLFADEINTIMKIGQLAVNENYDPHQFFLSAWIWLGSSTVAILYIFWCYLWISNGWNCILITNPRVRVFSILAIQAILTFVLSPPDTAARVQVAMLTGIAIAGLRDPFIFRR